MEPLTQEQCDWLADQLETDRYRMCSTLIAVVADLREGKYTQWLTRQ